MSSSPANPRNVESRLAPRFHQALVAMPRSPDESHTEDWAMALVADAVQWKASDIHLEPGTLETPDPAAGGWGAA